jgi:hypothetical protein
LFIGSEIVRASVEWTILDRDLMPLSLLSGTSSKKEMLCMTCPAGESWESMECLDVNRGERVTARVDFSMTQNCEKRLL